MADRDSHLKQTEVEMKEAEAKAALLEARARNLKAEEAAQQSSVLRKLANKLKAQVEKGRKMDEASWEQFRSGLDAGRQELAKAFKSASAQIAADNRASAKALRSEFDVLYAQIDVLQARIDHETEDRRRQIEPQVKQLREQSAGVRRKLDELEKADDDAFEDVRAGFDGEMSDWKKSFNDTISRVRVWGEKEAQPPSQRS